MLCFPRTLPGQVAALLFATLAAASARAQPPPQLIGTYPVAPFPPGNPTFASSGNIADLHRELLGKNLFWDEQLSTDHTVSCGTCHDPRSGGNDKNGGVRHPGLDGFLNTADDKFGSPGVVLSDTNRNFTPAPAFGLNRQATGLNAPTMIGAAFFEKLFWNKRATSPFTTVTGVPVQGFGVNAALESQAAGPPTNSVEMGHDLAANLQWPLIEAKLGALFPLHLAANIPPTFAVIPGVNYQQMFDIVYGPGPITREKISISIAAYMRTLIPNQAPIDTRQMTANEVAGLQLFDQANCDFCHSSGNQLNFTLVPNPPFGLQPVFSDPNDLLFTDGLAHNIGLTGHSTFPAGLFPDDGFGPGVKTPTLRNVGLHRFFFHSGHMTSLAQTMTQHYLIRQPPFGFAGLGPLGGPLSATQTQQVLDFLSNGLTDPRVRNGTVPFDFPTLRGDSVPFGSNLTGPGSPGTGGLVPIMIGNAPLNIGFNGWRLGLGNALTGAAATLWFSPAMLPGQVIGGVPIELDLSVGFPTGTITVPTPGTTATVQQPVPFNPGLIGLPMNWQWFVLDPAAAGGLAASRASSMVIL